MPVGPAAGGNAAGRRCTAGRKPGGTRLAGYAAACAQPNTLAQAIKSLAGIIKRGRPATAISNMAGWVSWVVPFPNPQVAPLAPSGCDPGGAFSLAQGPGAWLSIRTETDEAFGRLFA